MLNKVKFKNLIFIAFLLGTLSITINFIAAKTYPSWFDEAVFSDIAYNVSNYSVFHQSIVVNDGEVFIYGPVYFFISKFVVYFWGFGPLSMRSISGISVYVLFFLFYRVSLLLSRNGLVSILLTLLLIVDPEVNRSIVSGRMDMLATMFVFFSLYSLLKLRNNIDSKFIFIVSSLLNSLAFLTTPRALFLIPINLFVFLSVISKNNNLSEMPRRASVSKFVYWVIIFIIPIYFWIIANGGVVNYFSAFTNSNGNVKDHFGVSFIRRSVDFIIIILSLLLLFINIRTNIKNWILLGLTTVYLGFALFVKEIGPYASMIIPFNYLFLAVVWQEEIHFLKVFKFSLSNSVLMPLLVLFLSIFIYRGADVSFVNKNCRDLELLEDKLTSPIRGDYNVVASFDYYYLFKGRVSNLVEFKSYMDNFDRFDWRPDYIVLANQDNRSIENLYPGFTTKLKVNYDILGYYGCQNNCPSFLPFFKSHRNYNGTIVFVRRNLRS